MTIPDEPPRGLRWTATGTMRGVTTLVALIALAVAILVGVKQQLYINCVGRQQNRDAVRTEAISRATDAERAADRALIAGPTPGGPTIAQLRAIDTAAREHTDAVRAEYPPPPTGQC